jgi:hypothetical protein
LAGSSPVAGGTLFSVFVSGHWHLLPAMDTPEVFRNDGDPARTGRGTFRMGRSWTEPYAEIRQRMVADLTHPNLVKRVLADLELPTVIAI